MLLILIIDTPQYEEIDRCTFFIFSHFDHCSDYTFIFLWNCLVKGQIVDGKSVFTAEAELNQTAQLNCTAFSSESINIIWERNGTLLTNDNKYNIVTGIASITGGGQETYSALDVTSLERGDNGTYTCVVSDSENNITDFEDFEITVLGESRLNIVTIITLPWHFISLWMSFRLLANMRFACCALSS